MTFDEAATAAWNFVRPKLLDMNKEKGIAGVWSTGFRSGWDAADRGGDLLALDEAIRLFKSKRLALNSQFEAVDVLREDGIYQIVIEDLEEVRARHVKAAR